MNALDGCIVFQTFFLLFFLLPSRFLEAAVGFVSSLFPHFVYKKLANTSLLTFWHMGSYFWTETPGDPLLSFLPVVLYIQFVELRGCGVTLLVTLHILFIVCRLPSNRPLEKTVRNILVLASFFFVCLIVDVFFFFLEIKEINRNN